MSARWEKFWVAFFAATALFAFAFGVIVIFIWLLNRNGPLVAFPVIFFFLAVFCGVMHATSDDKESSR